MQSTEIIKNQYGFYQVQTVPSQEELNEYYAQKYYQNELVGYSHSYSTLELDWIKDKLDLKAYMIAQHGLKSSSSLLDVGCGEGFCMGYFKAQGWKVKGIDFSADGIERMNADCLPYFQQGDIYESIAAMKQHAERFDLVWLDNVLEHVIDPLALLQDCNALLHEGGLLMVEVPNDFSVLHDYLLENKLIDRKFWVALPDHLSYFNKEGLHNIAAEAHFKPLMTIADNPIDFDLLSPDSNYVMDKARGKNAHQKRMMLDGMMNKISIQKTVNYYQALADLGLGRQVICLFQKM